MKKLLSVMRKSIAPVALSLCMVLVTATPAFAFPAGVAAKGNIIQRINGTTASNQDPEDYPICYSNFNDHEVTDKNHVDGKYYVPDFTVEGGDLTVKFLTTYHWNGGEGDTPGTISLYDWDDNLIGEWEAEGRSGSGAENVNWDVYPDITLEKGHYYIVDSGTDTWSFNKQSNYYGFAEVRGETN